jgi:hypothetical protein
MTAGQTVHEHDSGRVWLPVLWGRDFEGNLVTIWQVDVLCGSRRLRGHLEVGGQNGLHMPIDQKRTRAKEQLGRHKRYVLI